MVASAVGGARGAGHGAPVSPTVIEGWVPFHPVQDEIATLVAFYKKAGERAKGTREDKFQKPWEVRATRSQAETGQNEVGGALGESLVAERLGRPWICKFGSDWHPDLVDVWPNIEVRAPDRREGRLIIRPGDLKGHPHIDWVAALTDRSRYEWRVQGFFCGKRPLLDEWLRDPGGKGPAWFIDERHLSPLGEMCDLGTVVADFAAAGWTLSVDGFVRPL